jgi:hypothetical protein
MIYMNLGIYLICKNVPRTRADGLRVELLIEPGKNEVIRKWVHETPGILVRLVVLRTLYIHVDEQKGYNQFFV